MSYVYQCLDQWSGKIDQRAGAQVPAGAGNLPDKSVRRQAQDISVRGFCLCPEKEMILRLVAASELYWNREGSCSVGMA